MGVALLRVAALPWIGVFGAVVPKLPATVSAGTTVAVLLLLARPKLDGSRASNRLRLGIVLFYTPVIIALARNPGGAQFIEAAKYIVFPFTVLAVTAGAAAAAIPPERILTEVLPAALEPPLADTLARALRPLDPAHGVATVSFADVMIDFDRRLGSDAFSLARLAIEDTVAEGVDLAAPLETIAALAREDLTFADEVHASFTLIRGPALTVFIFPVAFPGLYRLVAPSVVATAYADPAGWLIAGLVAAVCLGSYRLMTASERRAARAATGPAVPAPGAEDG